MVYLFPPKEHREEAGHIPHCILGLAGSEPARMEEGGSRPAALGPAGWKAPSLHLPALQSSWPTQSQLSQLQDQKGKLHRPLSTLQAGDRQKGLLPRYQFFLCTGTEAGEGVPPQTSLKSPTGEGALCCFPVFWSAAVSAIFKWLQLGTGRPAQQGSSRHPGLGSQLWKASPSHGCENSLSHWSQTQPTGGHPAIRRQPFP